VDEKAVDTNKPPEKGRTIELEFVFPAAKSVRVPFTEVPLATEWGKYLHSQLKSG
jgi:hypothetical protein